MVAKIRKLMGNNVPPSSFLMHIDPPAGTTSTTTSFRTRTVSTPPHPRAQEHTNDDHGNTTSASHNQSQSNLSESTRTRRASATTSSAYFSITKTFNISSSLGLFARRRKSTQQPQRSFTDPLTDVIEIGPEPGRREEGESSVNHEDEDAERERLRDAAAQALGLGRGRGTPEPDTAPASPVADQSTNPYVLDPIPHMPSFSTVTHAPSSLISLPNSYPKITPPIATIPVSNIMPRYPASLAALAPFIQTSSSIFKYHPASTFLAISFNRRVKQWKLRYIVLTSPPPESIPVDTRYTPNGDLPSIRQSHLHLFKSASPPPEEVEIDRLEINEDSVVFVAEVDVAGKRDVLKVGGRNARVNASGGISMKSGNGSWHGDTKIEGDANLEEMGRTMWLLKLTDSEETQRWIGCIKDAILGQRAERAGLTHLPQINGSAGVPNIRTDLDVLLSLRSQALLPSIALPPPSTPPYTKTNHHAPSKYFTQTTPSPNLATAATSNSTPTPNPRYADHVGAAPSRTSSTLRARTYPSPSNLPSLKKTLLSPTSAWGQGSRPSSPQTQSDDGHEHGKDIDPIADDIVTFGNRAAALLSLFRPGSRASTVTHNHNYEHKPTTPVNGVGIGTPISPVIYAEETVRAKSPTSDAGVGHIPGHGHASAFSVDWSMMNDSSTSTLNHRQNTTPSLPPPPRNHRRPSGPAKRPAPEASTQAATSHISRPLPTPLISPPTSAHSPQKPPSTSNSFRSAGGRPSSANSMSSYASAEQHSLEIERASSSSIRRSRTVPKMLAPPTGPPPSAPSLRARSPSGPPSPILEQDNVQRGGSRLEPSNNSSWGAHHPYSKRVSASSGLSVNTVSTGHSFLGTKAPPPPRPPPNFAPPPAPTDDTQISTVPPTASRDSFISRSLRHSLSPPAAPPTQSLPPRPDEPAYRHRRSHSSEVRSTSALYPIPASPPPPSFTARPPAPPPPQGPLPPTPDSDKDHPSLQDPAHPTLNRRLRIVSSPSPIPTHAPPPHKALLRSSTQFTDTRRLIGEPILPRSDGYPSMFLHMNDTPITPAMPHSPGFLLMQSEQEEDVEPTSLSPPPRRNSRNSKELKPSNPEHKPLVHAEVPLEPRDSAVVLE